MTKCPHCGAMSATAVFCDTCSKKISGAQANSYLNNGRYEVLGILGKGGMSAVYKARDVATGKIVAIKELSLSQTGNSPDEEKDAVARFNFEADTLLRLRHANLPRVYARFDEYPRHYLVMDFIEGQTLEERLHTHGGAALPETEVLSWARQLCDALTYLHSEVPPIIFRDLKPGNIMVTSDGHIYLIDFGIARVFIPGRLKDTQQYGTPGYSPPEQYGKAQTDARADIYALGCTLYELLTGYDPGTTPFALPPLRSRNPAVSQRVERAIERATKLDRDERYPTVADFAKDLLADASAPAPAPALVAAPTPAPAVKPIKSVTPRSISTRSARRAQYTPPPPPPPTSPVKGFAPGAVVSVASLRRAPAQTTNVSAGASAAPIRRALALVGLAVGIGNPAYFFFVFLPSHSTISAPSPADGVMNAYGCCGLWLIPAGIITSACACWFVQNRWLAIAGLAFSLAAIIIPLVVYIVASNAMSAQNGYGYSTTDSVPAASTTATSVISREPPPYVVNPPQATIFTTCGMKYSRIS